MVSSGIVGSIIVDPIAEHRGCHPFRRRRPGGFLGQRSTNRRFSEYSEPGRRHQSNDCREARLAANGHMTVAGRPLEVGTGHALEAVMYFNTAPIRVSAFCVAAVMCGTAPVFAQAETITA